MARCAVQRLLPVAHAQCGRPLVTVVLGTMFVLISGISHSADAAEVAEIAAPKKIAAIVTVYYHNSHADMIVGRLLETQTLDGLGKSYPLQLAGLYTDQVPPNDTSRAKSAKYGFPIYPTIAETLKLGTDKLAVDGVLLIAEHGDYPVSDTGQTVFPKRRMFEEVVQVFAESGAVTPVFVDKHLADNWTDAKWMYDTAQRMHIPLMAGSCLPLAHRRPQADVATDAKLREILAVSYHTLDAYGFHAVEAVQALAERRSGGETGVKSVQTLVDAAVWEAGKRGLYDPELLAATLRHMQRPVPTDRPLEEQVPNPVLFHVEYQDGLRTNLLTLNNAVADWAAAWRYEDGAVDSTLFWLQEDRPLVHFTHQLDGISSMMLTGKPAWPVERTLMTSGLLDALLISKKSAGQQLATPQLDFDYRCDWNWRQPPDPPPGRPLTGQ